MLCYIKLHKDNRDSLYKHCSIGRQHAFEQKTINNINVCDVGWFCL